MDIVGCCIAGDRLVIHLGLSRCAARLTCWLVGWLVGWFRARRDPIVLALLLNPPGASSAGLGPRNMLLDASGAAINIIGVSIDPGNVQHPFTHPASPFPHAGLVPFVMHAWYPLPPPRSTRSLDEDLWCDELWSSSPAVRVVNSTPCMTHPSMGKMLIAPIMTYALCRWG